MNIRFGGTIITAKRNENLIQGADCSSFHQGLIFATYNTGDAYYRVLPPETKAQCQPRAIQNQQADIQRLGQLSFLVLEEEGGDDYNGHDGFHQFIDRNPELKTVLKPDSEL